MPRTLTLCLLLCGYSTCGLLAHAQQPIPKPCDNAKHPRTLTIAGRPAFEVKVKMDVDVDGAPNAYGPPGKPALDVEVHAHAPRFSRHAGEVVGYMTEYPGGPPTIQRHGDPFPGYYVSQTTFADSKNPRMEDPRRYVDATKINYVVLGRAARRAGVQMGDFVVVTSCRTRRSAYAIVADDGNESGAEGSLALVQSLGYKFHDGISDSVDDREIVIRYFPRTNPTGQFFFTQAALDTAAHTLRLAK